MYGDTPSIQTPKVLLMQYTDREDKYILFKMLEKNIVRVVDYIKNGDIDPIQAVSLRGFSSHSTIFDYAVGEESEPRFDMRIFSIVYETPETSLRNATMDTFKDACVDALMSQLEEYGEKNTPLELVPEFLTSYFDDRLAAFDSEGYDIPDEFFKEILDNFNVFLSNNNFDIVRRIVQKDGNGPNSIIKTIISRMQNLYDNIEGFRVNPYIDGVDEYDEDLLEDLNERIGTLQETITTIITNLASQITDGDSNEDTEKSQCRKQMFFVYIFRLLPHVAE
jgi:hypothetical protein